MAKMLWNKYLHALKTRPMLTQVVQSGILMSTGDIIAQKLIEKNPELDLKRVARFAGLGCFFIAPVIRGWYLTMERIVGPQVAPFRAALSKVALDQVLFAPSINFAFISIIGKLQGLRLEGIKKKLNNEYYDVMINNWKLWPGVQLANFFFVPFLLRPLVVGVVALIWNSFLSWKTNQTKSN